MSDDSGSDKKDTSTRTMDFSDVDWSALKSGKGHLPFSESEAPPERQSPPANPEDGALPFAKGDPLASTAMGWPAAGSAPAAPPAQSQPPQPAPSRPSAPGQPPLPAASPSYPAPPQPSHPPAPSRPSQPAPSQPVMGHVPSHPPSQPHRSSVPHPPAQSPPRGSAPPAPAPAPAPADGSSPWAGGASKRAVSVQRVRPPVPSSAPAAVVAAPRRIEAVAADSMPASEGLDLLWAQPGCALRFRRQAAFKPIIDALEDKPVDVELDAASDDDEDHSVEDRREIFEVLAHAKATDGSGLREASRKAIRHDGKFVAPLVLLVAELSKPFDERARLEATITTVKPFVPPPPEKPKPNEDGTPVADPKMPPLLVAFEDATDFVGSADELCAPSIFGGFTKRIVEAFEAEDRELPMGYLDDGVERALLQQRKYQVRKLFGAPHLRTLLEVVGCEEPVPTYLPESLASELPMYKRFRVRLVAELHHRVDQYETSELALRVLALARVLPRGQ